MSFRLPVRIMPIVPLLVSAAFAFALPEPVIVSARIDDAAAKGEALIRVAELGRYSVSLSGGLGPSLELVDRMSGTIASGGARADAFLEPGEYKVRVSKRPGEHVSLSARAFRAVNATKDKAGFPLLSDDGAASSATLGEFDTRSFWVQVGSEGELIVEMEGRDLAGAVLWRDGVWETGIAPMAREYALTATRPMGFFEYSARVEPGTYLLTCYGGKRRVWGDDASDEPFSIRRGAVDIGASGDLRLTFDQSGIACFRVAGSTDLVQLEAKNNKGYSLSVSRADIGSSRLDVRSTSSITEKSNSLRIAVSAGGSSSQWIIAQGPPGEGIELRWLSTRGSGQSEGLQGRQLDQSWRGDAYIVSALSGFEASESIDLTGMFLRSNFRSNGYDPRLYSLLESDLLALAPDRDIRRKVNNLAPMSFLVLAQAGTYAIREKTAEVSARYSFTLFDDLRAGSYGTYTARPIVAIAGGAVSLGAKLYLVTIQPLKKGILDFWIGSADKSLRDVFAGEPDKPRTSLFRMSASGENPTDLFYTAAAPLSIDTRRLPLNPAAPFSLPVSAAKSAEIPVTFTASSTLYATDASVGFAVDGQILPPGAAVNSGDHSLRVISSSKDEVWVTVGAREVLPPYDGPEPRIIDPATLYPSFSEGKPAWLDFERETPVTYWLKVETPGTYSVGTEGRLRMRLEIRSLLHPELFKAEANAEGGNAYVTAYLKPGSYLVRAQALGRSMGRAGLVLSRPAVVDAGRLAGQGILRASVPADQFMSALVSLKEAKECSIACVGLSRDFQWRFEDEGGWPIGDPIQSGSIAELLAPGDYRWLSYPTDIATDRLFRLVDTAASNPPAPDPKARDLRLALGQSIRKVWLESAARDEDVFTIESPTALNARLLVGEGMKWRILGPDGAMVDAGRGGPPTAVKLARGTNLLRVLSVEPDNLKEYQVGITPIELFEGAAAQLPPGSSLPVSIGRAGFYEFWSFGRSEVEAALYRDDGSLVATSDRIDADWNFRMVVELSPGAYKLTLRPLAGASQGGEGAASPEQGYGSDQEAEYNGNQEAEFGLGGSLSDGQVRGLLDLLVNLPQRSRSDFLYKLSSGQLEAISSYIDQGDWSEDSGVPAIQRQVAGILQGEGGPSGGDGEDPGTITGAQAGIPASQGGAVTVSLVPRDSIPQKAQTSAFGLSVDLGAEVAVVDFKAGAAGVYRFAADSAGPTAISIYRDGQQLASGPSPLLFPFAAAGACSVRAWHPGGERAPISFVAAPIPAANLQTAAGAGLAVKPAESVAHIVSARRASLLVSAGKPLLVSMGLGNPFMPMPDGPVPGDSWIASADGKPLGQVSLSDFTLSDGATAGFELGQAPQSFLAEVPAGKVALIRAGQTPGEAALSALPASAYKPGEFDWSQEGRGAPAGLIGIREGNWQGLVWSPDPNPLKPQRRSIASLKLYQLGTARSLLPGASTSFQVPPLTAVSVSIGAAGQSARVSLESGMAAFGWSSDGHADGAIGALDAASTGWLEPSGASLTVVNAGNSPALCAIDLSPATVRPLVGANQGYESWLSLPGARSFQVNAPAGSTVWIDGDIASCRFYRDDGDLLEARPAAVDPAVAQKGILLTLPAGKGRIELDAGAGLLKLAVAGPGGFGPAWAGRDQGLKEQTPPSAPTPTNSLAGALMAWSAPLLPGAQTWSLPIASDAIVRIQADGEGILAVYDQSGKLLGLDWGGAGQSLLRLLPKGRYSILVRPWAGRQRLGSLRFEQLSPALAPEGRGEALLVAPGEDRLFAFDVASPGLVGAGLAAESEDSLSSLFDANLGLLGSGRIFIRSLKPGRYYLLVENGQSTQRYSTLLYGLSGSRTETPPSVVNEYSGEE